MRPADETDEQTAREGLWSFVVPAWNEEAVLPDTLAALHAAARGADLPYEVIVADDASSDGTAACARSHGARVVACRHRQIAATRNTGAAAAAGDVLVFVDADTTITVDAVVGARTALAAGADYGGADIAFDTPLPAWMRWGVRFGLFVYRRCGAASPAFLFCTRKIFERSGGFDERLYAAEEWDLSRRLRRLGTYAWVPHPVTTSARKVRANGGFTLCRTLARLVLRGRRGLRRREGLEMWYDERHRTPSR